MSECQKKVFGRGRTIFLLLLAFFEHNGKKPVSAGGIFLFLCVFWKTRKVGINNQSQAKQKNSTSQGIGFMNF